MNFSLKNIVESISITAIIGGLVLVAYQIEQSTQIARAQIRNDYASSWIDIDTNRQSESLSTVLAKSLNNADTLTLTEMIQLDGYYSGIIDQMYSASVQFKNGLRKGSYEDLNMTFNNIANTYFGNMYAQAWWSESKKLWLLPNNESNFVYSIDKAIIAVDPNRMNNFYSSIKQSLKIKD